MIRILWALLLCTACTPSIPSRYVDLAKLEVPPRERFPDASAVVLLREDIILNGVGPKSCPISGCGTTSSLSSTNEASTART
jgi:hypothetical protein